MNNALVIILYDHPRSHTADYINQACEYFRKKNIVVGVLWNDACTPADVIFRRKSFRFLRKVNNNFYLVTPLYILPSRRYKVIQMNRKINTVILLAVLNLLFPKKSIRDRYVIAYHPDQINIIGLFGRACNKIYDCVDYHREHDPLHKEKDLIRSCRWVFVNSDILYTLHSAIRRDIYKVPLGFDAAVFQGHKASSTSLLPHKKPVVGYVGGINIRLDFRLLQSLIDRNRKWVFAFVGPVQQWEPVDEFQRVVMPKIRKLTSSPNVIYIPRLEKDEIVRIIREFDVCIIPYDCSKKFNAYSFPMKTLEYFYEEKPVVTTPIEELKRYTKYLRIATTVREWEHAVGDCLSIPMKDTVRKKQRRIAIEHSWEKKFSAMERIIHRDAA